MPDEQILEDYAALTYNDAAQKLNRRFSVEPRQLPPLTEIKTRRKLDEGDAWRNGDGFIGQMPTGEDVADRTELLRRAFTPEDIITEVLDTHVQNVVGDAPAISIESEDLSDAEIEETLEIVNSWLDDRNFQTVMSDALRGTRRESARLLRQFIPSGMIDGEGRIEAADLSEALSKIWIRSEPIEAGGVLVDEATATRLALFLYKMRIGRGDVSLCEYAFINREGNTVWGTTSAHTAGEGSEEAEPFQLGGRLPIYQMTAPVLISESSVRQQDKANLAGTMGTRNINLAGSRERAALDVEPPGEYIPAGTDEAGNTIFVFEPGELKTGPGTMNFYKSRTVRDEQGNITAFANPNLIFTDPVSPETFNITAATARSVIYSRAKMRHLLMSDDATASGKSRIEARKEFQSSLNESKQVVDAAAEWAIETALNIAAHFMGTPGRFLRTKVKFESEVSTIELTPEEIAQIREDFIAGLIDRQTALEMRGIKNVQEILDRGAGGQSGVTFQLGDRVKIKGAPHMPGQTTGTIALVQGTAYGIIFDGMESMGVHKWYVAEELESIAESAAQTNDKTKPMEMTH